MKARSGDGVVNFNLIYFAACMCCQRQYNTFKLYAAMKSHVKYQFVLFYKAALTHGVQTIKTLQQCRTAIIN